MKFLVDAQLPVRLSYLLKSMGYDSIHTKELILRNATPDTEINMISISQQRIVITKDSDFWDSFHIQQQPYKLLLVATGNISNRELEAIFAKNLEKITQLFEKHSLIEIGRNMVTVHQ
jgi:predicted nuclease of predicted toxin-antitoxin system